ncbi:MAG: thermonuclease family protein [Clostridiales bacterium]|nr:thermonuclease family protein [Clostridiales bacterium]
MKSTSSLSVGARCGRFFKRRLVAILVMTLLITVNTSACSYSPEDLLDALAQFSSAEDFSSDTISSSVDEDTSDSSELNAIAPITEAFTVVHVVDGDTIWVEDDQGERFKIRIIGVDAPETEKYDQEGEPFAQEAFNFAKQVLSNRIVYLERDVSDTDQYDRLLRYVWLEKPDDGAASTFEQLNFSALLVRGGYARVVAYGDDTRYESELRALEKLAKSDHLGIWAYS